MEHSERELKYKLREIKDKELEVEEEERAYYDREWQFDYESRQVQDE